MINESVDSPVTKSFVEITKKTKAGVWASKAEEHIVGECIWTWSQSHENTGVWKLIQ